MFLDILANYQPKEIMINDINPELINTYIQIRDNVKPVIDLLYDMQDSFWSMNTNQRKEYFYTKRKEFNSLIQQKISNVLKAALFIFLNKTCFNGLYRVNINGLYNVPMGAYKKPLICDEEKLKTISMLLKDVEIQCDDYSSCAEFIDSNTFVYIDPPYRPLNETASFTSYANTEFGDVQQIELARFIEDINEKGASIITSNSDPKNVNMNDNFFDELYEKFSIDRIMATRMINSDSSKRGPIKELLIYNF